MKSNYLLINYFALNLMLPILSVVLLCLAVQEPDTRFVFTQFFLFIFYYWHSDRESKNLSRTDIAVKIFLVFFTQGYILIYLAFKEVAFVYKKVFGPYLQFPAGDNIVKAASIPVKKFLIGLGFSPEHSTRISYVAGGLVGTNYFSHKVKAGKITYSLKLNRELYQSVLDGKQKVPLEDADYHEHANFTLKQLDWQFQNGQVELINTNGVVYESAQKTVSLISDKIETFI